MDLAKDPMPQGSLARSTTHKIEVVEALGVSRHGQDIESDIPPALRAIEFESSHQGIVGSCI